MKRYPSFILLTLMIMCFSTLKAGKRRELKPRLVVMTDICPADLEPDDTESAIRLLAYADCFEIEALIPSVGWNSNPYPPEWMKYLECVIDAYEKDVYNLMKRSRQTSFHPLKKEQAMAQPIGYWPSADYLRSCLALGSPKAGIGVIGEGNDTPGSRKIIELLDEDDERPIYFCAWGGANTLAQAVWRLQHDRNQKDFKRILHKIRLYTITDQDMVWAMRNQKDYSSHMWLRKEFSNDLMLIWDESAWLNHNDLGNKNWKRHERLIQGHGEMGRIYPKNKYGVEGDTPSFFHCMPNGLNDPDDPTQVGWGGYHQFGLSPDSLTYSWTNWQQPVKDYSNHFEVRFYPDEFNDFAARMQWAAEGKGTTNPVVIVNGKRGHSPIRIKANVGQTIKLNAGNSYDPEGESLRFLWWEQLPVNNQTGVLTGTSATQSPVLTVTVPPSYEGRKIQLVCEVHDDSPFQLVSYRRVIINVAD